MTRAEAARKLCEQLCTEITAFAPDGVGLLDRTWDIVAPADAEFMLALSGWEATGSAADRAKVRAAYARVLDAWREAVSEFEQQRAG